MLLIDSRMAHVSGFDVPIVTVTYK